MARTTRRAPTSPALLFIFSIIFSLSLLHVAHASSAPRPQIALLNEPVVEAIEVFPRRNLPLSQQHKRDTPVLLHSDSFRLTLIVFNETLLLHLRPNDDLVHPAARINHWSNGVLVATEPLRRESVLAYHGDVVSVASGHHRMAEDIAGGLRQGSRAETVGWARILMHTVGSDPLFEGVITVRGTALTVATADNYARNARPGDAPAPPGARMVVYTARTREGGTGCAHDSLRYNVDPTENPLVRGPPAAREAWWDPLDFAFGVHIPDLGTSPLVRRDDISGSADGDNFINSIGQTTGCPKTQQIVYMGVAADCAYVRNYGSKENATTAILNDWNAATAEYKSTFNVSLGIVTLDVQDSACPAQADPNNAWNVDCSADVTLNDRLSLFSAWRGQRAGDGIGLWHLMSGCPTGTEVGVAWLGTLCVDTSSGDAPNVTSGTAVSTAGPTEWEVVTHEIGHNFGAIHDCTTPCTTSDQCCPFSSSSCSSTTQFIMNPTSSSTEKAFSPCSIGNICTRLSSGLNTSCLADPAGPNARTTIALQMCGNGIVEAGEECDPGAGEQSACCDAATCKFVAGAVCDPASSPCCTAQCGFAPATTVCRPALDAACDVAEVCDGKQAACPADVTKPNGMTCGKVGSDTLTCASGLCTSVSQQCQMTGASLNLTTACSQQSGTGCSLSCQDPSDAGRCLVLQAMLPNGLGCNYGGTCANGVCIPGSALDTAKAWYLQNLQLAIPITVVAGVIVILLAFGLTSWIVRRCRGGRQSRVLAVPADRPDRRPVSQSLEGLMGQPQPMARSQPPVLPPVRVGSSRVHRVADTRRGQRLVDAQRDAGAYDARRGDPFAGPAQPPRARRARDNWVDDTLYNGPRMR